MVGFVKRTGVTTQFVLVVGFRQSMKRFRPMGVRSASCVSVLGKEKALSIMVI
jgi:hypothetical protein